MNPECDPANPKGRFSAGAAFVDGAVVPVGEACIPLTDWGFLHGDATYDVVHVWRGRFFRLPDHLARFRCNCERMKYDSLPVDIDGIPPVLANLVTIAGLEAAAYVAMIATRGLPAPGSRDPRTCRNRFYAFAIPFVWIADFDHQARGLHVAISTVRRIPPASVDPTVKNYHWLDLTAGLMEAYGRGAETVVLTDDAGNVIEGPGFNLFVVGRDGSLATPVSGVLEGITRKTVMEVCAEMNLLVQTRPVAAADLLEAEEAFATSTAGGVMPITRVDGRPIGNGRPGARTLQLRERYWALHEEPSHTLGLAEV